MEYDIENDIDIEIKTKECRTCHLAYPATTEFFSRKANARDGLNSTCKECDAERSAYQKSENNKSRLEQEAQMKRLIGEAKFQANGRVSCESCYYEMECSRRIFTAMELMCEIPNMGNLIHAGDYTNIHAGESI